MSRIVTRLTSKGQFTLPRHLREALGVKPGDYVALTPTDDGVLVSSVELSERRIREGERVLIQLVREIGAQMEAEGITEEQVDEWIEEDKREIFKQMYGEHLL